MVDADRREALGRLVTSLFSREVSIGIAFADDETVLPEEKAQTRGMVPARLREFAAGRRAARRAIGRDVAIVQGADRAPMWPAGVAGSISHSEGWAVAAVAHGRRMIGLDLEPDADLPAEIWDTVLLPEERAALAAGPQAGRWARVIFSAKECAYKAQYPLSKALFGFEALLVTLDLRAKTFTATFQIDAAPFARGDVLAGRFARGEGVIVTAVSG